VSRAGVIEDQSLDPKQRALATLGGDPPGPQRPESSAPSSARAARLLGLALAACAPLRSQEVLWQATGQVDVSAFWEFVTVVGDVDGDGYEDLASLGRAPQPISVLRILSGRTGAVLRTRVPIPSHYVFHRLAPAGDWNGDGVRDYVVSRYGAFPPFGPTCIEVLSGRDDHQLFAASFAPYLGWGEEILSDADTDGDGVPDLVASAARELPIGGVYVYRPDGSVRYRLALSGGTLTHLGAVGDVDGDGCDDFGYWDYDPSYPGGAVRIVSGRTGTRLYTVSGDVAGDGLGSGMIVPCGDVDGDRVSDFAVSSDGHAPTRGIVRVFSGRDGSTIHTFRKAFGQYGSAFSWGEALASGFDLDQDGIQDLVVGGCQFDCDPVRQVGDRLYVYLLRDGREIEICTPDLPLISTFTWFGFRVAAGRPHPGNPFPVFACGELYYGFSSLLNKQGRITLLRLPPSVVRPYGDPCFGTLGRAPRLGVADLGAQGVRVHASNAPPGAPSVLLVGDSDRTWHGIPLPIKLSPLGFTDCELRTSVLLALSTVTGTRGAASGYGFVDVPLPLASSGSTGTLYAQWLVLGSGDQAPGALSAAVSWRY